ncbi:uridine phosphorylase [Hyperthermus butylicus]|uniref:Uridine phosphorylase n=1 Tax=Hyperthermus butylicus (strain DSM 5456 / JCM 9403 / PLM1-5) TaxID=415426 RepID=A2BJ06_HYPBU|nr:uridine phosphorylase [Hyperthermus butylicus]ABM79967.1 Uridine phosphorylase [Hyperthermus butylicus DSM 5456]
MERPSAKAPTVEGKMYHIMLGPGEIPPYVLLPGDPGRIDDIVATWDEWRELAFHREYRSVKGRYKGVEIGAVSTGIGGPSTAIAVEELARIGVHTFIRVGTTGAIQPDIELGTVIIGYAAVRYDGASGEYAPPEYPAAATPEVVLALVEAAERLGVPYRVGVVASTATFHLGQSRPGFRGYEWSRSRERLADLQRMGVLSFEMEAATIFTLASLYGLRAGCVCAAIANRVTDEFKPGVGVREAILVANEAVRILAEADREKGRKPASITTLYNAVRKLYG